MSGAASNDHAPKWVLLKRKLDLEQKLEATKRELDKRNREVTDAFYNRPRATYSIEQVSEHSGLDPEFVRNNLERRGLIESGANSVTREAAEELMLDAGLRPPVNVSSAPAYTASLRERETAARVLVTVRDDAREDGGAK